jgi:acyl-coenzyme A synthetase/AMP-(fatty) acid ligase
MNIFLKQDGIIYYYDDLLNEINANNNGYYPLYKETNLFKYFVNLIKALVSNENLVLIDSDTNKFEIEEIDESDVNILKSIQVPFLPDVKSIVEAIQNSTSEITIFTSGTTGQPKKVSHSVNSLLRAVRKGEKYSSQIWAFAYNPTHMAGIQVFFQSFINLNELICVFNKSRSDVYNLIIDNKITHISATPTFFKW